MRPSMLSLTAACALAAAGCHFPLATTDGGAHDGGLRDGTSGCVPLPSCSGSGGGTSPAVTAMRMTALAEPVAAAWASDAILYGITASDVGASGTPPEEGTWTLRYTSGCRSGDLAITVGISSYAATCEGATGPGLAPRTWAVDSDQAVLLGESEGLPPPVTLTLYPTGATVGASSRDPVWVLVDGAGRTLVLDASNGSPVR